MHTVGNPLSEHGVFRVFRIEMHGIAVVDQFGKGEAFLPELVMAGEAMKAAVATLDP